MREITEQQILVIAPNSTAALNGKKISQNGSFVRLERSEDDTFYMGECKGSGKRNYITTIDFADQNNPIISCSCPSRQFPCKHGVALLYEIMLKKDFKLCDIPDTLIKKREKREKRKQNDDIKNDEVKKSSKKVSTAAATKKIKKQIEGLDILKKLIHDLINMGLGTIGGVSLSSYKQISKQLGNYYLPGAQRILNALILEMDAFQTDTNEKRYERTLKIIEKLNALEKKSRIYLNNKLETGNVKNDDSFIYEELGGVWKLSELEEIGLYKKDTCLTQLSFWVKLDRARGEYIDTGCWIDIDTGDIVMTYNYRPFKALKYVKQYDTVFGTAKINTLFYYPGNGNKRVRWDDAQIVDVKNSDIEKIRAHAIRDFTPEIKRIKNIIKDALSPSIVFSLFYFKRIALLGDNFVIEDEYNNTITLLSHEDMEDTIKTLSILPDENFFKEQVILGGVYYSENKIYMQPLSIISQDKILRLLY